MRLLSFILFVFSVTALSTVPEFDKYTYMNADGKKIKLSLGNASPLVTDWDGDGDKDLLVGRFSYGNIMIFDNAGTNAAPDLTFSGFLKAGGKTLSVGSG